MGKGDKKTKRGKIIIGSYGVRRSRKKGSPAIIEKKAENKPLKAGDTTDESKPVPKKKPTRKTTTAKTETEKKTPEKKEVDSNPDSASEETIKEEKTDLSEEK